MAAIIVSGTPVHLPPPPPKSYLQLCALVVGTCVFFRLSSRLLPHKRLLSVPTVVFSSAVLTVGDRAVHYDSIGPTGFSEGQIGLSHHYTWERDFSLNKSFTLGIYVLYRSVSHQ